MTKHIIFENQANFVCQSLNILIGLHWGGIERFSNYNYYIWSPIDHSQINFCKNKPRFALLQIFFKDYFRNEWVNGVLVEAS